MSSSFSLSIPGYGVDAIAVSTPLHRRVGILFLLYLAQGVAMALTTVSIPILLRAQGASLEAIGWSGALMLPWFLKPLLGAKVDRCWCARFGRRRSWLLPAVGISVLAMFLLAGSYPHVDTRDWWVLLLVLNTSGAVGDIALDGYATDICRPGERAWGAWAQTGGTACAMFLGGGITLQLIGVIGWSSTLMLLALVNLIAWGMLCFHREQAVCGEPELKREEARLWSVLRSRDVWRSALLLVLLAHAGFIGHGLFNALLIDSGISPARIGQWTVWWGGPFRILGTLACAACLARWSLRRVFPLPAMLNLLFAVGLVLASNWTAHWPEWFPIAVLVTVQLITGWWTGMLFFVMMQASAGTMAATRFSLFQSATMLTILSAGPILGGIGDRVGYSPLFAINAVKIAVAALAVWVVLRRTRFFRHLKEDPAQTESPAQTVTP